MEKEGFFNWIKTNIFFWIIVLLWTAISFIFNPDEIELFLISPSAGFVSMALNFIIIVAVVAIPFSIYYIIRSLYKLKKEIEKLEKK
ncbi:hypothetical protein LCGC14_1962500 [marine sediment metagenome]|uniref:Lipopolysaccharide assembly protein A domain-containing protein n=1 Tax=marine sediment metagenome TaxID=412755 RepID=A0A0F9HSJ2_9ZZZZ